MLAMTRLHMIALILVLFHDALEGNELLGSAPCESMFRKVLDVLHMVHGRLRRLRGQLCCRAVFLNEG